MKEEHMTSVQVNDLAALPDNLVTITIQVKRDEFYKISGIRYQITDIKPDKATIKALIQEGEKVAGAELIQAERVRIS